VALVGFAGAANASATVDLVWIDVSVTATSGAVICLRPTKRDCPQLGTTLTSVAVTDNITLAVILTAGPGGSVGGALSVDYSDAIPELGVIGFQSLTTAMPASYLPLSLGTTFDSGTFVGNITAGAVPWFGQGIGLPVGQSAYLGTVSFHKDQLINGTSEIFPNADNAGDGILDGAGNYISGTSTFNSAFLVQVSCGCICDFEIEVNALRAGGKPIQAGPSKAVNVTSKARILKGTAPPGTTIDTTLTIEALDGTAVISTNSTGPIRLGVGKGGKGAKLSLDIPQCNSGFIDFVATFSGVDAAQDLCERTRTLRKECKYSLDCLGHLFAGFVSRMQVSGLVLS
jgi:hypothetical protein